MNVSPRKALILYTHTLLPQDLDLPNVRETVSRGCCGQLKLEKESVPVLDSVIASRSRDIRQLLGMSATSAKVKILLKSILHKYYALTISIYFVGKYIELEVASIVEDLDTQTYSHTVKIWCNESRRHIYGCSNHRQLQAI